LVHSLARVSVSSQLTTIEAIFNNFNIVDILPTKASLGFEPSSDKEQIVDDLKLLAFKIAKVEHTSDSEKDEEGTQLPEGPVVVLRNNFLHHTFENDEILLLEYAHPGPFTINHVIVKGSRISKNPVRHAFFWAFNEKPGATSIDEEPFSSLVSVVNRDEGDHLVVKWPHVEPKPEHPFAHVEVGRTSYYGEAQLERPVTGRYIAVIFADNWECKKSKDKATVQYVGFVGPAEKPNFKRNLGSKFGLQ